MPQTPGPRTGLAKLLTSPPSDPPTIFRSTLNAIIDWLEGNATLTSSGLLANRPVSTPANPGISGRSYYATDLGVIFRDTGTGWVPTGAALAGTYATRPAASADLNGVRFFATDKAMEWQCISGAWVLVNVFAPEVTSLPASPVDQQECLYLADTANGIKWHLRYRAASSSAYKWEYVGGPPLAAGNTSSGTRAPGTGFGPLTGTSSPSIVVPLAGDYDIDFGATISNNAAGGSTTEFGVQIGGAAIADNTVHAAEDAGSPISPWRSIRRNVPAVSTTIQTYASSSAGTAAFSEMELRVRPMRVG